MSRFFIAMILGGCVVEREVSASPELRLSGVELVDQAGNTVAAERAAVEPDGRGEGWGVRARLAGDEAEDSWQGAPPPLEIQSRHSNWDLAERRVEFRGGVVAVRGEMQLSCETLEVRLGEADAIEEATARGDVLVNQGDRSMTAESAVLHTATGRLVLAGSPVVRVGENALSGERVTLWLDSNQLDCEGCSVLFEYPEPDE